MTEISILTGREMLLEKLDSAFLKIALDDIRRASNITVNTTLAPFILGCCFLDAIAGFYEGQTDHHARGGGRRFVKFAEKYLPQYDAYNLWTSLRCGLVHAYAEKGKYLFVNKKSQFHLKKHQNGQVIVDDEGFIGDLENAYTAFKEDILI